MRVLELFAGYGSQALALENLGIEFTSDISEIDKYAIQAYNQLHGETHNWGDITKIDETKLPYYDLITYSFPCQDISLAGLQRGLDNDSGTRSSLLWECERIIRAVKPKYLLMENVKNLVGEKHKHNFIKWLRILEEMGYQNWWQVLNAKDYGVPQNRERVFVVSILGMGQYLFPNPIKLEKRLKDILEPKVDEKYYISSQMINYILGKQSKEYNFRVEISNPDTIRETPIRAAGDLAVVKEPICIGGMQEHQSIKKDGIATCLTSSMGTGGGHVSMVTEPNIIEGTASALTAKMAKCGVTDSYIQEPIALDEQNKCIRYNGTVGTLITDGSSPKHNNRVIEPLCVASRGRGNGQELEFQKEPISNTLTSVQKYNYVVEPKIIEEDFNLYPNSGNPQAGRVYNAEGISPAMDTCSGGNRMPKITSDYRIRKLTPRECWRLMGVRDEQFDRISGISNSQLYKLAGNSIVVDVLMGIFKNMFLENDSKGQLTLL